MSNLQLRVISAMVLIVVVLVPTWFGGMPFRVIAAAIGGLVFHEWTSVSGASRDRISWGAAWAVVVVGMIGIVAGADPEYLLAYAVLAAVAMLAVGSARGQGAELAKGMAYALLPAVALAALRGTTPSGLWAMVYIFAIVWATDIFAYFIGRAVGGPKLAPSISPGKTWSGAVGGTVCAMLAAAAVALAHGGASAWVLVLLALPLSVVSQIGDLFESRFKRRFGVKDSSNLIPGHGGVMDRVDGLVAAAAALYLAVLLLFGSDAPSLALFPG